ncbi:MAG: hypothetical protein H0V17_22345 [Deltaproteobacteria bacterium]|nr:hypothetical protein [Deltaproteobacteria bacterium]
MRALQIALVVVGLAACKSEPPPIVKEEDKKPLLPPAELQRASEACAGYVAKVCACAETALDLKEECALAKLLPEAIDLAKRLASSPKADGEDAVQAAANVRKTVRQCIEKTAKLPERGCP